MASHEELKQRDWKADWPYYLRVVDPVFVDGMMGDCVMLYDLIRSLDYKSFPSTLKRYNSGERKIKPLLSLAQQPGVQLTYDAANWIDHRFQQTLIGKGMIDSGFIDSLPSSIAVNL